VLTTEILAGTIISSAFQETSAIQPRVWELVEETGEEPGSPSEQEAVQEQEETEPRIRPTDQLEQEPITISSSLILTTTGITRTEQDESSIAYTGTWQTITAQKASSSAIVRADDPGDTAEFTFTGMEVSLGFIGSSASAIVEVFIDGVSQGTADLYRREDTPLRFTYNSFITGAHTISFTHSGTSNPNSTNDYVQFDYFDVRDGMLPPDGTFEQDDSSRIFSSNTWGTINNPTASGGSYHRDPTATVWFPFSGDSVTYHYIPYNNGGVADIFIDNQWVTRVEQYNISLITETISFDGLGPGFHMMMVTTYRGQVTVDAFSTPGTGPFYTPVNPTGFTRFEDDNSALLYNGLPFTVTNPSWTRVNPVLAGAASEGQYIYSNTADDTVSLTFDGVWAAVGFYKEDLAGMAEVFVDGVSQGIVDTYSTEDDVTSWEIVRHARAAAGAQRHARHVPILGDVDADLVVRRARRGLVVADGKRTDAKRDSQITLEQ
jgi:hypothetical protein